MRGLMTGPTTELYSSKSHYRERQGRGTCIWTVIQNICIPYKMIVRTIIVGLYLLKKYVSLVYRC